jgi:iron(III) transport system permease protein
MKRKTLRWDMWTGVSLGLSLFYLLVIVWPLVNLLRSSVSNGGGFTWSHFSEFFSSKLYYDSLLNSIKVTVCVTALALLVAFPLAYLMTMYRIRGSGLAQILILVSMMSPPFIGAYSWILLLGNNGLITNTLTRVLGFKMPSIYGFPGILLVLTLQLVPLIFTYLMGAWKTVDVSLLEASESLSCTGVKRAFKVIAPLLLPTVLAGSLLVFVRAFADFGTPMLIGQGYRTVPVLIYSSFVGEVGTDVGFAAAVAMIVIVVTLGIFLIQKYLAGRRTFSMTAMRPIEPKRLPGIRSGLAHAYVYGFLALATLPLVVVVVSAFRNTKYGRFVKGYSFANFTKASRDITDGLRNTLTIGLTALAIIVVAAIAVSYVAVRRRTAFNGVLDTMTMVPYVVPGLVIGIALLVAYNKPPIILSGTATIMVIALVMRRLPYTVRSTSALLYQHSPSVEEASLSLGASKFKTLRRVVVPMLAPGILSGAILSWVTIITELSCTLFLYTTSTRTLSLAIYATVVRGQLGTAAAISVVLMAMTLTSLALLMRLPGGHRDVRF